MLAWTNPERQHHVAGAAAPDAGRSGVSGPGRRGGAGGAACASASLGEQKMTGPPPAPDIFCSLIAKRAGTKHTTG